MRTVYVLRDGRLVERVRAADANASAGPFVIADGMDPTMNPADGLHYDSKRAFHRAVRRAGCEIMGNEAPTRAPEPRFTPSVTGRDIKRAIEQLGG